MSSPISQKPPADAEPSERRAGDEVPAVSEHLADKQHDNEETDTRDDESIADAGPAEPGDQEQAPVDEATGNGDREAPVTGTERTHLSQQLSSAAVITGTEQTHLADPSMTGPMLPPQTAEARAAQTKALSPKAQAAKPIPRYCFSCGAELGEDRSTCKACGKRQQDPLVGKVLEDRYEVVRRLGEGAMGAVYEVRHLRLNKPFAMKVIHAELAQVPEFVARFEREALSCSRLAHPNCISVTDFGRASSGELFLVMEYVEGRSLDDLLRKKPLPVGHALDVTRQVLLGLQHAHQAGIIHRDIKPENVMLVEDAGEWRVKILDFGIAKVPVGEQGGQLTQAGVVFGTPEYMAPEQALSTGVDARADLYSTGVMLWRMLTARPLFTGDGPVEILSAKLSTSAPSLDSSVPGVYSLRLQQFVDRALQRRPSDRFPDAQQMLDELEQIQGDVGRGLAIRPQLSRITMFWNRSVQLAATTRKVFVDWYLCPEDAGPTTWKGRLRALVTTTRGRTVLVLSLVALGLMALVPVALLSTEPARRPGGGGPAESWVKRAFKQAVMPNRVTKQKPPTDDDLPDGLKERLTKVRLFMAKGLCREASLDLKNMLKVRPKLPQAHYLLGAAMVCRRSYAEGLASYGRAIELEPRYRADARILEDAQRLIDSTRASTEDRVAAVNFLGTKVGQSALPVLVKVANEHKNRHLRKHALALVVWLGAKDRIDWVATLSLDLEQLPKCKDRAKVVARLRALGDPRAVEALRKARDARSGIFGLRRKNYCCRKQIVAAIKELLEE